MATLLKNFDKFHISGNNVNDSPTDEDFIKCLDYDLLERKFGCFKYYPKFLNNYDYLTPEIKEMIGDKPVYSKANKHLKNFKNPGTKKTFVTEIDVETGQITVKEKVEKKDRKARKEERRARREEHREVRKEKREERKERRERDPRERKESRIKEPARQRKELLEADPLASSATSHARPNRDSRQASVATGNSDGTQNLGPLGGGKAEVVKVSNGHAGAGDAGFRFNNPFAELSTLVSSEAPLKAPLMSRQNSVASRLIGLARDRQGSVHSGIRPRENSVQPLEKPRKFTLSLKLREMIMPHRYTEEETLSDLQRTQLYDQTRSTMTSKRGAKSGFLKMSNDGKARRRSEQFGTYY